MQRNKELDSLRAFAILFVMVSHWTPYGGLLSYSFGGMGVDMFFVLSGFLMTLILLKARLHLHELGRLKTLGNFYIRRILRIFPVYYFSLFIFLFFASGTGLKAHLDSFLLFTSNFYLFDLGHWDGMISHLWSLSVEIQFYLFWPFVLLFLPKQGLRPLFILGIFGGLISRIYYFYFGGLTHEQVGLMLVLPQNCIDLFCFGALVASEKLGTPNRGRLFFPFFFAVLVLVGMSVLELPDLILFRTIVGFGMTGLLHYCLQENTGMAGRFLRLKPLVFFGQISYAVYIYHNLAEYLVLRVLAPGPLAVLLMFGLVLLMASLSWFLLENPINRLKLKFKIV